MEPTLPPASYPETVQLPQVEAGGETSQPVGRERGHETAPLSSTTPAITTVPQVQPLAPQQPTNSNDSVQPVTTTTPVIADDTDVIEKEWVDKAKQIVSATRDDPHLQEKAVSKLQADYLMKRYNKQIKLSE